MNRNLAHMIAPGGANVGYERGTGLEMARKGFQQQLTGMSNGYTPGSMGSGFFAYNPTKMTANRLAALQHTSRGQLHNPEQDINKGWSSSTLNPNFHQYMMFGSGSAPNIPSVKPGGYFNKYTEQFARPIRPSFAKPPANRLATLGQQYQNVQPVQQAQQAVANVEQPVAQQQNVVQQQAENVTSPIANQQVSQPINQISFNPPNAIVDNPFIQSTQNQSQIGSQAPVTQGPVNKLPLKPIQTGPVKPVGKPIIRPIGKPAFNKGVKK